jgi:CDP-diacylglycerol--serine O-phosphatidyltransferase
MKWLKNNLANFFTLGNLACGFLGIVAVTNKSFDSAFWLFILAIVLDFFDGFIARATKTTSKIGADLDSLADMVTFGILPGFLVYDSLPSFKYLAIIIPILSAWRLAKFNNDTRENTYFYGLPTPANAILVMGAFMYRAKTYCGNSFFEDGFELPDEKPFLRFFVVLMFSALMVSDIKLLSNKIKPFTLANAKWHLLVLLVAVILISLFGYLGVSLAIISYVLISIIITFATAKSSKNIS